MDLLAIATLAGASYSGYSAGRMWRFYTQAKNDGIGLKHAETSAQGIQFYRIKKNYIPPTYVNTGNHGSVGISIPVGGGISEGREFVYSLWQTVAGHNTGVWGGLWASHDPAAEKRWINTPADLSAICAQNGVLQHAVRADFPLRAVQFKWNQPVWFDLKSAAISTNRAWVAKQATLVRRMPLTFSVMGLSLVSAIYLATARG